MGTLFKPLLTKAERKTLDSESRSKLRAQRRAERREDRPKLSVHVANLRKMVTPLILDLVADTIPGQDKMNEILDDLAERIDEILVWGWTGPLLSGPLELVDGWGLRLIAREVLRPYVQRIYDDLKKKGRIR